MRQRIMKSQVAEEFLLAPMSKVLVVDDDSADLQYHTQLLEGQGHNVFPCSSYLLGADLVESNDYDFVVVGQGSPAFEGRIVMERLLQRNRTTPVLVLARSMDTGCYLDAMQLGAIDYLEKPVHPAEMRRIMRTHLQAALVTQ